MLAPLNHQNYNNQKEHFWYKSLKIHLLFLVVLIGIVGCNTNQKGNEGPTYDVGGDTNINGVVENVEVELSGYELMVQKCYICHFGKPDPERKEEMIAPPMLRVQEHYKPAYPNKDEFVTAVLDYFKNPSQEKTLMPGAVKKFNLMPKLLYDDSDVRLIAETLYNYDFGSAPKMRMQMMGNAGIQLNNGEKWKLKPESMKLMNAVIKKVNSFSSDEIADYNQLGKDVFSEAKRLMLDESYTEKEFDQIHLFFSGIEGNMHLLMAIQSMDEAKKQLVELSEKLNKFNSYFE